MSDNTTMIVPVTDYNPETDVLYTKPKVNPSGGKNVGILNKNSRKGTYLSTPLMLTWGVNEYVDEKSGKRTYDMSLQFPKEEWKTDQTQQFLDNMVAFENKLKADAITNSKEWMNKGKMSSEVIDALWTPMLRYAKDPETGDPDKTRAPTLRLKIPFWENEWNTELYDMNQNQLFPNDDGKTPVELISKASNVAVVMQNGGIWFANGKFGTTWKLFQAVIKPKASLRGKCHIQLGTEDKQKLNNQRDEDEDEGGRCCSGFGF